VPEKPTVNFFRVEPGTLTAGQTGVLRWSVANATTLAINNGVGTVKPEGTYEVRPGSTTTYRLEARNASGTAQAIVTVPVTRPAPTEVVPGKSSNSSSEIAASRLQDIHFDYNAGEILAEEQSILEKDAAVLKELFILDPKIVIRIEGHCDEQGSAEYNLGLGDRRAIVVKQALVNAGLPAENLETVSFGKERLLCVETTDECHARNRRAHFSVAP
jgi:peptidoglycan-associated lipoprotein